MELLKSRSVELAGLPDKSKMDFVPVDDCLEGALRSISQPLRAIELLIFKSLEAQGNEISSEWQLLSHVGNTISGYLGALDYALKNAKLDGEPILVRTRIEHAFKVEGASHD